MGGRQTPIIAEGTNDYFGLFIANGTGDIFGPLPVSNRRGAFNLDIDTVPAPSAVLPVASAFGLMAFRRRR